MFVTKNNYTVQEFRDVVSIRGFQSSSRYTVRFRRNFGDTEPKMMYPESLVLPEKQIITMRDLGYTTPRDIPISSDQGSVLLSFITMKDWKERIYFENWMNFVAYGNDSVNILGRDKCFVLPYNVSSSAWMSLEFYDERISDTVTKQYNFYEVYPQAISPTEFNAGSAGYNTFQVILNARSRNFNSQNASL